MTTEVNQVLKKTEQGIEKWNQIKQKKIDSVIDQITKIIELLANPETRVGYGGLITTDVVNEIVHEFIIEKNSILYGFDTKAEYRAALKAAISKKLNSIAEENENG